MNLNSFVQLLSRLSVKHRDTGEMVHFNLFPNQVTAVRMLAEQYERTGKIRAIFLKSRRVTVSSLCDALLFCDCLSGPHRENLIVAHVKDTSEGLFRVPRDLANGLRKQSSACHRDITVLTKSIEVKHSTGTSSLDIATAGTVASGRGLTLSGLHISESARIGTESFDSLIPAVSKGRNTYIFNESTAFGKIGIGEAFYEAWQSAVSRKSEYIPIFLGWLQDPACVADDQLASDAPATDLEKELMRDFKATKGQIAWMRTVLESECRGYEGTFLQEYPHTPSVAFQSTGEPAFMPEEINFAESTCKEPKQVGHMEWKGTQPQFVAGRNGALCIWSEPKPGHKYYIGMDAAVGKADGDFAAVSVIDGTTGEQVAQYADRVVPEAVAFILHCLGHWYNKAIINGELTGNSGREVLRILRDKYHYGNLAVWRGKDDKILRNTTKNPTIWWEMTFYSRRKLFDCFRIAVRGGMRQEDFRIMVRDKALWMQMAEATMLDCGSWDILRGHDDILVSVMLAVVTIAQNPVPKMQNQSKLDLTFIGESEDDQLKRVIPVVVDDAVLSLRRHYAKAMALSMKAESGKFRLGRPGKTGIDRLAGI